MEMGHGEAGDKLGSWALPRLSAAAIKSLEMSVTGVTSTQLPRLKKYLLYLTSISPVDEKCPISFDDPGMSHMRSALWGCLKEPFF